MTYRHIQHIPAVFPFLIAFASGLALAVAIWIADMFNLWIVIGLGLIVGTGEFLLFQWLASLSIAVEDQRLKWHFGPGVWRKQLPLDEIVSAVPVRNKWYWGWGVRLTPHGWLYNVHGLDAVEIATRNGRKIRLGTDDPEGLANALSTMRASGATAPG